MSDWNYDMKSCPIDTKVRLLSAGDCPILPQKEFIGTITKNERRGKCYSGYSDYFYRSELVAWKPFDRNKIVKANYTRRIDEHDYSELICTFEDGTKKTFHFCATNPMPKEYVIEGLTWEELTGVYIGMFRMAIGEYVKIKE